MQIQNSKQNYSNGNPERLREDANKNYIKNLIQKQINLNQSIQNDQFGANISHKVQLKNINPHNYSYCKYLLSAVSELHDYSGSARLHQGHVENKFKKISKTIEWCQEEQQQLRKRISNFRMESRILVGRLQFYIQKYFIRIDSVLAKQRFLNELKLIFEYLKGNPELYSQNKPQKIQKNQLEEQETS